MFYLQGVLPGEMCLFNGKCLMFNAATFFSQTLTVIRFPAAALSRMISSTKMQFLRHTHLVHQSYYEKLDIVSQHLHHRHISLCWRIS